jgi:hypothetical protein
LQAKLKAYIIVNTGGAFMEIKEMIELLNSGICTRKELANDMKMSRDNLTAIFKEAGYVYDFKEQKYLYKEEVAVTIEENDESNIESKEEINIEINQELDVLLEAIIEKPKYVPINTHLRPDINLALNKWAKDKNIRGAKQELINGLLEIALKRSGYLK